MNQSISSSEILRQLKQKQNLRDAEKMQQATNDEVFWKAIDIINEKITNVSSSIKWEKYFYVRYYPLDMDNSVPELYDNVYLQKRVARYFLLEGYSCSWKEETFYLYLPNIFTHLHRFFVLCFLYCYLFFNPSAEKQKYLPNSIYRQPPKIEQ